MSNDPSEVYANVRNKALEEAAKVCEAAKDWDKFAEHWPSPDDIAHAIRGLKTPERA